MFIENAPEIFFKGFFLGASLIVAIGLFADLGTWAMSHEPIHMTLFVWIIILAFMLIYSHVIITTLYFYLKDAWLRGILGPMDEGNAGLTHGGKRVTVY